MSPTLPQEKGLDELYHREEEEAVEENAEKAGVSYIDLGGLGIDTDALATIPEEESRRLEIAGFKLIGKNLHLACRYPDREATKAKIAELEKKGRSVIPYMVSHYSLNKAWQRYEDISMSSATRGSFLDISPEALAEVTKAVKTNKDVEALFNDRLQEKTGHKISRILEVLFGSAIGLKASDIHIEPEEDRVRIRFREDGVLEDIIFFDAKTYKMINSRIKLLSEMKLTQQSMAQDGRFTINYNNVEIEIRCSIIPGAYGEGIVMRILNPEGLTVGFDQLGIEPKLLEILKKEIAKPNGLILTTGPTGSGKTTTLYSFLKYVYTPEIKIITIEDPIEYHLPGITQTQVEHDKGYDFLAGLRAALRQDPDVIMVGEIRDNETATIAVNSSLTGHLVLSTLHTNDAAGVIPRLLDLGINPGILAAALSASIAQRLIRKLCKECKKKRAATPEEEALIRPILKEAEKSGKDLKAYGVTSDQKLEVWEPVGCDQCNKVGYKGRIGIYEAILTTEAIEALLERTPSEREVRNAAKDQGLFTMVEDGVLKVLTGTTSLEELKSVVSLENEEQALGEEGKEHDEASSDNHENTDDHMHSSHEDETNHNDHYSYESISHEPHGSSSSPLQTTELSLLIDYLKTLEREQLEHPEVGIAEKIRKIKDTVIEVLEKNDISSLLNTQNESVEGEVSLIMEDLKKLEEHQTKKPEVGVAKKLKSIRTALENLSAD